MQQTFYVGCLSWWIKNYAKSKFLFIMKFAKLRPSVWGGSTREHVHHRELQPEILVDSIWLRWAFCGWCIFGKSLATADMLRWKSFNMLMKLWNARSFVTTEWEIFLWASLLDGNKIAEWIEANIPLTKIWFSSTQIWFIYGFSLCSQLRVHLMLC